MQRNPPGDSRWHAAEPRIHGREEIQHPAVGRIAKEPSFCFLVIHRGKNRHQTLKFAVCHGLGGRHRDRKIPSSFCALCSQIELPVLHRKHFGGLPVVLG